MRRNWFAILLFAVLILFGTVYEVQGGRSFTQWAMTASASSEYGSGGDWSAKQMLGRPDFYPNYGDSGYAWAPAYRDDGLQWVELGFAEAVYVERVEIYETFNPGGAIVTIGLVDTTGRSHVIWEGTGGGFAGTTARVFSVKNGIVTVPAKGGCGLHWIRTPLVVGMRLTP